MSYPLVQTILLGYANNFMCFLQNFTSTLPWATAKLHNLNRELQGQTHTLAEILCRRVEG